MKRLTCHDHCVLEARCSAALDYAPRIRDGTKRPLVVLATGWLPPLCNDQNASERTRQWRLIRPMKHASVRSFALPPNRLQRRRAATNDCGDRIAIVERLTALHAYHTDHLTVILDLRYPCTASISTTAARSSTSGRTTFRFMSGTLPRFAIEASSSSRSVRDTAAHPRCGSATSGLLQRW